MPEVSSQFLFFFSALGAFNGLLLAGYVCVTRRSQSSYWFLAALLVMISVRVGKSVLFYFYPELDKTILQIGLSACFLIGPMLYFYTVTTLRHARTLHTLQIWHLATLVLATLVFGLLFPYIEFPELWGTYIYKLVNYTWLLYIVLSWFYIYKSFDNQSALFQKENMLLLSVNIGVATIWLAYYTASYTSYIFGALSFSFILYVAVVIFFGGKSKPNPVPYQAKKFDQQTVSDLSQKLEQTILADDYYCDPLLSMPQLAQKMGVSPAQVSQLLNDNFKKTFTTYVNELRIEKAKSLLTSEQTMTMEVIAERCGYSSMSTFYGAFKKIVETTPAKYRQKHK